MKGWRISSFGVENLEAFESPIPKVSAGQVAVKVHAASLNYRDLMMVKGFYNPKMALPRIPCSDGAGKIVEVGDEVTDFKTASPVFSCNAGSTALHRPPSKGQRWAATSTACSPNMSSST
jgi:NADPH:quinone reductase-like Zn-dependent oxidoreductase